MIAIAKIDALTVKVLHEKCAQKQPGLALETVYRWRTALKDGRGINDNRKRLLIDATAETENPIAWSDFMPVSEAA